MFKKYRLNDGHIYWHKLYFDIVPEWMTKYAPPFGDYNYAAYLYQPHKYMVALWDHAKWFVQRGYRGYAECDVWSIDGYLTSWMPQALRRLKLTSHGTPIGMRPKQWRDTLEKMAEGFDMVKRIQNYDFDTKDKYACAKLERKFHKRMNLFNKHFLALWD